MATCGFKWWARYLHSPPSKRVTSTEQICIKDKDHKDEHMSRGKVIHPNANEK